MTEAGVFLRALSAAKPDDLYISLWTLSKKESHWFKDVDAAIRFVEKNPDRDIYVGVGLSGQDYGTYRRCPSDEVAGIVGLWADIDLHSGAHDKALPATVEDALRILPPELQPTFVIRTGNGIHVWWFLREPYIFDSAADRIAIANLSRRWQWLLQANARAYGWVFERLGDLARVLRVPGTKNCKDRSNAKPVTILQHRDSRYNVTDFEEYLEQQGVAGIDELEAKAKAPVTLDDSELVVNTDASLPEELLNHLLASDPLFAQTWARQRIDMKDQTRSGYDMSLANFGTKHGLTHQQIVDLCVQHRRMHGLKQQYDVGYYKRTISKAMSASLRATPEKKQDGEAQPENRSAKSVAQSPIEKAVVCEQLSRALGIIVIRIIKISGQYPTYRMDLERGSVHFESVDKLITKRHCRNILASATERLIPQFNPKQWDNIAQMLLDAVTIQDGGDESDLNGEARLDVERYLTDTPFIDAYDANLDRQDKFKPAVVEGHITLRALELQQHIYKTRGELLSPSKVAARLAAIGAENIRLKSTALRDQTRWFLPVEDFPPERFASRVEATYGN